MAYRRRQQATATSSSNFSSTNPSPVSSYRRRSHEDFVDVEVDVDLDVDHSSNSTVLASKAIRASSAAHRDSSLSSAYAFNHPSPSPSPSPSPIPPPSLSPKDAKPDHEYTSMNTLNESKKGFWSNLARKAKSIIEDDFAPPSPKQPPDSSSKTAYWSPRSTSEPKTPYFSRDSSRKAETPPTLQKGLSAISSSLNYIGNAVEEGLTIVENRTAGIIQETRKHIQKKPNAGQNQPTTTRSSSWQQPQMQTHKQSPQMETDQELQLKASRDVAMAMAAKAKLLLRELKTVKADFAFAKERCAQLEEENKILRENRGRGESLEDDDLIRLQLETLLAEKARLAHENSVCARENRFLREVVEYHQLTMQDVVYFDEGSEEVTEVYPIKMSAPPVASFDTTAPLTRDILPHPVPPPALLEVPKTTAIDTRKLPSPSD